MVIDSVLRPVVIPACLPATGPSFTAPIEDCPVGDRVGRTASAGLLVETPVSRTGAVLGAARPVNRQRPESVPQSRAHEIAVRVATSAESARPRSGAKTTPEVTMR